MLTRTEYHDLWEDYFRKPIGVANPPDYDEYVRHEQMLEDYKDLFRGRNTRGDGTIRGGNTLDENEHPFLQELGTKERKVRFILVAEARPEPRYGVAEYFYNYKRNATKYLKIVHKATYATLGPGEAGVTAFDRLVDLANRGVLLMDLFPFAIQYTPSDRKSLCAAGTINAAWNGIGAMHLYPENLEHRLQHIAGMLHKDWDLALIAPTKTTCCILNNGGHNHPITTPVAGIHPSVFGDLNYHPQRALCCNERKKAAISSSNYPTYALITEALK